MSDESNRKMRETNIKKHGSYEAWKQALRERGHKGGKLGGGIGGFTDKELASRAGKIGRRNQLKGGEDVS